MYKHWKEVSYEEFMVLGLAGVHVCSVGRTETMHDVEWPDAHWHSLDNGTIECDFTDPPQEGEKFFVRISCEE